MKIYVCTIDLMAKLHVGEMKLMKENCYKPLSLLFSIALLMFSCTGTETQTQVTKIHADDVYKRQPVSNILVIAITGNEHNRRSYENKFVARLKSVGVDAVASEAAIPMPPDLKLQKETILKAVSQFGNDAVIITQLVGKETKEIRTRDQHNIGPFFYYSIYPGYSSESKTLRLETNLYDAKTGGLIWSGRSKTLGSDSIDRINNDAIKAVIDNWQKNKIIAAK
jgi:hypothetical protein